MPIRTPADLGALIRDHRTRLGLDQKSLAQKVGFSRQWIVEVEKGKPRAASGLLLRTVDALGLCWMPINRVRENRRTLTPLRVWTRMSIWIPSSTPRAGKESERRTHRHS